jgi:serine/threonine-protein kinase BUR1
VLKGVSIKTKKVVALKKILMHNEREGMPITALREIKILKALSHPNVIELIEIAFKQGNRKNRQRGTIYMVFPYMDHDLCGLRFPLY